MTRRLVHLGVAASLLLTSACSGVQTPLAPAGDQARDIKVVFDAMMIVCGVMYVLVLAFLGWAIWRRRKDLGLAPATGHTAAEPLLERGLVGWAVLVVLGLTILITVSFLIDRRLADEGPRPLHIKVTANQWWWAIEYQDPVQPSRNVRTANELHLPLGRPARVELQSNDVIHSFWIPNLAGKEDLIPGRVNRLVMTPRSLGQFRGQCAEFCGLQHANMALDVKVESAADFEQWRQSQLQPAASPSGAAVIGRQVFMSKACVMCHAIAGTSAGGVTGPDLTHVASRKTLAAGTLPNTREQLARWIDDPTRIKPGTNMPKVKLTPDELSEVTDYLASLR